MSSTSSSECMCSECYKFAAGYKSPRFPGTFPYYQTLGHPLIYYAKVPTPNFRQRTRDSRKENPNCFIKAFRWYTQDHHPAQSRELPSDRTDLVGFASWLDKKYDEFMLERRAEQEPDQKLHGSQLDSVKTVNYTPCDQTQKNTFSRIKSPFMKRRRPRACCAKDSGDTPDKCNQSFEYILKPKELSRPTSECCHQIPSTDTQTSKKTITKIRAHSSERTVYEKCNSVPIEVIKIEGSRTQTFSNSLTAERKPVDCCGVKGTWPRIPAKSVSEFSCQCPEEELVTVEAHVQCDCEVDKRRMADYLLSDYYCCPNCSRRDRVVSVSDYSACPSQIRKDNSVNQSPMTKCECQDKSVSESKGVLKRDAQSQHQQDYKNAECYCTIDDSLKSSGAGTSIQLVEPMLASSTNRCLCSKISTRPVTIRETIEDDKAIGPRNVITTETSAVQTSDHPICIDTDAYPLFMKICFADKLQEETARK